MAEIVHIGETLDGQPMVLLQGRWVPESEVSGERLANWINDPEATDIILDRCTWNCKLGCWEMDA